MYVNAVLSPPPGTSTVVESSCEAVRFVAALEVSQDTESDWIVELWYGYKDGREWKPAAFSLVPSTELTVHDTSKHRGLQRRIYTLNLPNNGNSSPLKYTLRLKPEINSSWIWIRDQTQLGDGQIIFRQPTVAASVTFDSLFSNSDPDLLVRSIVCQSGVDLFEVTATAPAINNEWSNANVGTPISLEHFYALVKIRSPWMGPRQGTDTFVVDSDALIMGYLRADGRHVVVLGIAGLGSTTTYIRSGSGRVLLKSLNDSGEPQLHRALVATGLDWQTTVDAAFDAARVLLAGSGITEDNSPPELEPLWRESWYDGLGYCTWNSLGRELTQARILDSLQDLRDNGILVTTLIIDDNWQSLDSKMRWDKFEANEHFPNGLKGLTSEIRRRFNHIKHIAVWHAVIGYWEGIAPDWGWIAANYSTTTIKWHEGQDVTLVDETDIDRLYNDFYSFLYDSGIDSIKCDVQASLTQFDNAVDRKRLCPAYQHAFKVNGLKYFSGKVIYCMAMVPQIFFPSLLQQNGPTVLLRNSDDFYPDIPDSHLWHLFCNAMNNIYTSHLNCLPDWDMFQTSLSVYGEVHAAGRCVSGGPIYITDSPGSHSLPLVRQMSAASVREPNRLISLRPSTPSLPLDPYVAYNGNRLLKLATVSHASSMLAVFNVSSGENSELISLLEFKGLKKECFYVVRQQSTGKVFGPATAADNTFVSVTLPAAGWEFLSAVQVTNWGSFGIGVLGLVGQLSGVAGVVDMVMGKHGAMIAAVVTVKALGVLGFYISDLKTRKIDDMLVTIADTPVPVHTVTKSKRDLTVLELDIETAWKELGLKSRWGNDVIIKLFL